MTSGNRATTEPGADDRQLVRLRRYLVASAVFGVVFLALPSDLKPLWYSLFGWFTVVVAWRRVRGLGPAVRRPAALIVLAGTLSLLGGLVRALDGAVRDLRYPFPSVAEPLAVLPMLLFLAAILTIVHRRVRRFTLDPIIDSIVGGVAVALVQWTVVLIPYLRDAPATTAAKTTNIVYAVLSLLLVVAAVLALVSGAQRSTSNRLLAAGLVATFALDVAATLVTAGFLDNDARLYVAPFAFIFGCAGLLHPSVDLLTSRPSDPTLLRRLTSRRIAALALALITPPTLIVLGLLRGDPNLLILPGVASLALSPLVVTRLGRLVRQNEKLASLESALRAVGERLVSSESTEDVSRVITVGAEQLLGAELVEGALVLEPFEEATVASAGELGELLRATSAALDGRDHPVNAELVPLVAPRPGQHAIAGLVVVQRTVKAVLVLVTRRPLNDDETNAITTLCRETAIALRAVEQTELQVRRRSEDRFAALVDNSSDIVAVLRGDLELQYVSPVARRLLGYPLENLPELDVMGLVHPADRDLATTLLDNVRFGIREAVELRLRHFAGTYHWFEVVGVDLSSDPNIGGILLNLREIGDRKEAEEKLVLSEARFKALVQHSTDLVIVLDAAGEVRYASPSVHDVLGTEPSEVLGRSLHRLFPSSDMDWDAKLRDRVPVAGELPELLEFTFQRSDGEWRTIETTITDLRAEPAVGGYVLNARDVTERKGMEQRLRYHATHDELTGLANRVQALDELEGMLGRNSGSTTVAAILVGIDDFKEINDSLGHEFGDEVLKAVAARITSLLGFGDVAARVGGDEFVVVLERSHGESHVTDLADRMLAAIASPLVVEDRELNITASAGIVFDHDRSNTGAILLRNADIAMYRAKAAGKRQAVVFESQMHTASYDRLELRADLARAITSEQFRVHYQPVVDISTRRIVGAEALIRWEHPERGMLAPNLFIPLAEETGLIDQLGEWILRRACNDLVRWRTDRGGDLDEFTISVNLSVQQLQDDTIVETVADILDSAGLPPERLVLEVTESTLITDTAEIAERMRELRGLGTRLAVDDFGTGYSSLGYIQQFDFDVLKIDKSFVDGLEATTNQQIVTAVLDLARQLGVRTIAEGIETDEQAAILERLGCSFGQGYLYSRPVAEADFRELLEADRVGAGGGRPL